MTYTGKKVHGLAGLKTWKLITLAGALILSACTLPIGGQQHTPKPDGHFGVKEIGSMHIGGKQVTLAGLPEREIVFTPGSPPFRVNPNGDFESEQMYLQYVKLHDPYRRANFPMLMMHGGGLTGVTWETKPDGKPGWQMAFLRAGHDVYVADAVERGRASWSRFPEIYKSEPFFRTKKEGWELFRIGPANSYDSEPAKRKKIGDTRFPVDAFDHFMKQGVPRWATNDVATQSAYDTFIDQHCPCVIVVHSQGANFAFNAALKNPSKIKAIVAVEPSGSPDPEKVSLASLKAVPHLFVWGDHLDQHPLWPRIKGNLDKYREGLVKAEVKAELIDLAARGIKGNSHMLMMDNNSDDIALMVNTWLKDQGLVK